jgi:peroxiredoxin family protein
MPPEPPTRNRGLALVVQSGAFDQVHMALSMAAAAAAVGLPATLFFTLRALAALDGADGWRRLSGAEADATYVARGIVGFEELLASCRELGVRFMACEMGLAAVGLEGAAFRADLAIEQGGLATLLLEAAGADLVYV